MAMTSRLPDQSLIWNGKKKLHRILECLQNLKVKVVPGESLDLAGNVESTTIIKSITSKTKERAKASGRLTERMLKETSIGT